MTRYKDLRSHIELLQQIGEIQTIDVEVDWMLEMGAVTRRTMDLRLPAPLFNAIKGCDKGFRALGAPGGLSKVDVQKYSRVTTAFGLDKDASPLEVVRTLAATRSRALVKPVTVEAQSAACKKFVVTGNDVDLTKFPVPWIHRHDNGRYLQTYGLNIVKSPDGSWSNWSINRMQMLDGQKLGCLIPPNQHLGIIHAQWKALGKPTPIAIAFGVEPALPFIGGMPLPQGMDEIEFLGSYFGEPIELVKAETVDLLVPATAEIIVEGFISHDETAFEGPMDEYPGYVGYKGSLKPVLNVSAITHRENPILVFSCAGAPVDENHTGWGIPHSAEILHLLRDVTSLPVDICWMVPESACHLMVIALDPAWHELSGLSSIDISKAIGEAVFASKAGFGVAKIVLVENDIDVTNVEELCWAFSSRAHPEHGEILFPQEAQNALPVFLDPDEKHTFRAMKVIHNALLADRFEHDNRPVKSDFSRGWSQETQRLVLDRWTSYGFKENLS